MAIEGNPISTLRGKNAIANPPRPVTGRPPGIPGIALRLPMRQEELENLTEEARSRGGEVEEFIVMQLRLYGMAKTGDVLLPLDQAKSLSKTLGRNFGGEGRSMNLAYHVANLARLSVADLQVQLSPNLLQRLRTRCLGKQNFYEWLEKVIVTELERFVGLR